MFHARRGFYTVLISGQSRSNEQSMSYADRFVIMTPTPMTGECAVCGYAFALDPRERDDAA